MSYIFRIIKLSRQKLKLSTMYSNLPLRMSRLRNVSAAIYNGNNKTYVKLIKKYNQMNAGCKSRSLRPSKKERLLEH